jgi:hypothetical protein
MPSRAAPKAARARAPRASTSAAHDSALSPPSPPRAVKRQRGRAPKRAAEPSLGDAVVIVVDVGLSGSSADALHAAAAALPNGSYALCGGADADGGLPARATHLVRDDTSSWTLRTYLAVARGLALVTPAFVFESLEAGRWLVAAGFACATLGPAPALSAAARARGWSGALGGARVCLYGETHLPRSAVAALVRAAGGVVERSHRAADVLVADCEGAAAAAAVRGRAVVSTKWLFDQIAAAPTQRAAQLTPEQRTPPSLAVGALSAAKTQRPAATQRPCAHARSLRVGGAESCAGAAADAERLQGEADALSEAY